LSTISTVWRIGEWATSTNHAARRHRAAFSPLIAIVRGTDIRERGVARCQTKLATSDARTVLLMTSNLPRGIEPASGIASRAFSAGDSIVAASANVSSMIAG